MDIALAFLCVYSSIYCILIPNIAPCLALLDIGDIIALSEIMADRGTTHPTAQVSFSPLPASPPLGIFGGSAGEAGRQTGRRVSILIKEGHQT